MSWLAEDLYFFLWIKNFMVFLSAPEMTRYVALMASVLTSSGMFGKCKRGHSKWSEVPYSESFNKNRQESTKQNLCSTKCGVFFLLFVCCGFFVAFFFVCFYHSGSPRIVCGCDFPAAAVMTPYASPEPAFGTAQCIYF